MYHYFLAVDQSETYMTFKTFYFLLQNLKSILTVWPEDEADWGRFGH